MKINLNARKYEGLPAASALGMALMESTGIRQLIDDECEWDRNQRVLSPGMAVKAMLGPMMDGRRKAPLYKVNLFYQSAPVDLLFGDGVAQMSLSDSALARGLDTIFDAGVEELFWKCSSMVCRRFGIDYKVLHMDPTDISVDAIEQPDPEDGTAVPRHSGHAKDKRNEDLQYAMQTVVNSERVLMHLRPYSGNTSDFTMNLDTLATLEKRIDVTRSTIVADCKLVNSIIIKKMLKMEVGFVSKVPEGFADKIRSNILYSVRQGYTDPCRQITGWSVYDTDAVAEGKELRFIACRNESAVRKKMRHLTTKVRATSQSTLDTLSRKTFMCEKDARKAFEETVKRIEKKGPYSAIAEYEPFETYDRGNKRGRPRKGEEPERRIEWRVVPTLTVDNEKLESMAEDGGTTVLVTNLPRAQDDAENPRDGATADSVLRLYLDQYKIEHTYRLMKSGLGIDRVFLHTPSRENAMMFVIGIATLICDIIDAMSRRRQGDGSIRTFKTVTEELVGTQVRYDRGTDSLDVEGPPERADQLQSIMSMMGVDPELLLGFEKAY